jgi:hypothetical protein
VSRRVAPAGAASSLVAETGGWEPPRLCPLGGNGAVSPKPAKTGFHLGVRSRFWGCPPLPRPSHSEPDRAGSRTGCSPVPLFAAPCKAGAVSRRYFLRLDRSSNLRGRRERRASGEWERSDQGGLLASCACSPSRRAILVLGTKQLPDHPGATTSPPWWISSKGAGQGLPPGAGPRGVASPVRGT